MYVVWLQLYARICLNAAPKCDCIIDGVFNEIQLHFAVLMLDVSLVRDEG